MLLNRSENKFCLPAIFFIRKSVQSAVSEGSNSTETGMILMDGSSISCAAKGLGQIETQLKMEAKKASLIGFRKVENLKIILLGVIACS